MWGSIRGKAHPLPRNAQSNGQHFSGAMEPYTRVRFAEKLTPCHTQTHMHRSAYQRGDGGKFGQVQTASTHGDGSSILVYGAVIEICHTTKLNIDATALRAGMLTFRKTHVSLLTFRKTHVALPRHTANSEHTIGA